MFTKLKTSLLVRRLTGTRFIVPAIIAFLAFAMLAVSASAWWSGSRKPENSGQASEPGQTSQRKVPIVLTSLTRFGFQPAAMKLPEGKVLLVVRNISGADKLQLELAEVRGKKLVAEKPKEEKPFWEKPLNLKAGEYRLSVTENPNWVLTLTVVAPDQYRER